MPKKTPKMPLPVYVPSPKSVFLEKMRNRMHAHQSLRLGARGDVAVVVLTAAELEALIRLAEGLPYK